MRRFILLINIFISINAYSQFINVPTPNAATLAVFGQYPVSSFTGVPLIGVPIYNFNYKGLSLPIGLNYNTNIVKPDIHSGWVGMGWNLNAGGNISRVVNDKPDDVSFYIPIFHEHTGEASVGYYYNYNYMSASNWFESSRVNGAAYDINNYNHNKSIYPSMNFIKDYSTDEYSFSVGDISGSFYLDHEGKWKVKSKTAIRVEVNDEDFAYGPVRPWPALGNNPPKYFPDVKYLFRITLVDTRGIKYVFGGVQNSLETNEWQVSWVKTWHITSIIFPDGDQIGYSYEKPDPITVPARSYHHVNSGTTSYGSTTVTPVYLRNIRTSAHDINFFRSELPGEFAKLDSIVVADMLTGKIKHKYSFNYENTPMSPLKLKLKTVSELDVKNQVAARHTFLYDAASFSGNNVDHWGYFSQKPVGVGSYTNFYNARETDTASCRVGLLAAVVYPTGGYTKYTWEPNSYSKQIPKIRSNPLTDYGMNKYTGGVRIKQVTNFDQNNIKLGVKSYNYNRDFIPGVETGISSGVLSSMPEYKHLPETDGFDDAYSFLPGLPLIENNTGSHITYSRVTEINADGSYTVTDFSNFDNGVNGEYMDEPAVGNYGNYIAPAYLEQKFISNSHERGFPLRERIYSNSSNLLHDKIIDYQRVDKEASAVRLYDMAVMPESQWGYEFLWRGSALKIYTNEYSLIKETNIKYDNNGLNPITNVTEYQYNRKQIKSILNTDSRGKQNKIHYRYPFDVINYTIGLSAPDVITHPISRMIYNNQIGTPVETIETILKDNNEYVVSSSATTHKGFKYFNGRETVLPYNILKAEMKMPKLMNAFTQFIVTNNGTTELNTLDAVMKPSTVFGNYDFRSNVLSVQNGNPGMKSGYIWGFNCNYPIATIKNALDSEVSYADFEYATDCFPGNEGHWKIPQLSSGQMYSFFNPTVGYNSKGSFIGPLITSKNVPQNDYILSFHAKGTGTLKINGIDKSISGDWQYYSYPLSNITSVTLENPGNLLIDNLMLRPNHALITTYLYRPLTGIISQTDPKGLTTYYEYDSFQRLRNIKDHYGNIIKTFCYNYAGQLMDCNSYEAVPGN